jgi:hypothetical protein
MTPDARILDDALGTGGCNTRGGNGVGDQGSDTGGLYGASVQKFNGNKKFEGKRIHRILQNSEKFDEIWENSTEMHLMSERNRFFLKTQKSAEFAELSAELADNSAE